MNKILKYILWSFIGIAATVSTVLAYVALTFDPNAYKPQIIQAVQESIGRTLKLDGDIQLMFFPSIGARLGKVTLSEYRSDQEFASVADAEVSLAVWPLLRKKIVVNKITVDGARINIVKYRNGKTNLDDLLGQNPEVEAVEPMPNKPSSAVAFDVAGVEILNCGLQFEDQATGNKINISEFNLKTGRLGEGIQTPVEFSAHIETLQPSARIAVQMISTLSLNLEQGRYGLKGMEFNAEGTVLDVSGLMLKLAGDVSADLPAEDFSFNQLVLNASGEKAGAPFEVHLAMPSIAAKKGDFAGESLQFKASFDGTFGKANALLNLPSFRGNMEKFSLQNLSLQADLAQPKQTFATKIDTELVGSLNTMQFNLKDLNVALKASGDNFPGKVIESSLKGSVQADIQRQNVHAQFAGGLLQSQIKAEASIKNFKAPVIRYDVEIDKLDLDSYLPDAKQEAAEPEQPFDLAVLKGLDVNGRLRIGAFTAANVKLTKLNMGLNAKRGIVNVEPLSASLYQGNINGKVRIDAHTSSFAITQKLAGVQIAPLLMDAAKLELAEGKGNIALAVTTRGNAVSALKKSLNGTASIDLVDGAIRGIDLGKLVQGLQRLNMNSRAETMGVNKDEKTQFSEFKASFKIKNGVAHNDDLSVKSTMLRLGGNGDVNLGNNTIDYQAKVILAKTDQGRTGTLPVTVYGPFDAVKIKIDYAALLGDVAQQRLQGVLKQKLQPQPDGTQTGVEEKLKQGLKGLFK